MIHTLSLEEFASRRRKAQTDIEGRLHPVVERAVDTATDTGGWDELLDYVLEEYQRVYVEEGGEGMPRPPMDHPQNWRDELLKTLRKTKAPRTEQTVERITVWLATWILSEATMSAAATDPEELFLEWVDMHDDKVRPAHRDANGQVRPIGETYDVGGVKMRYPGDPTAPIELWINCRCTLRPVLARDELLAAAKPLVAKEKTDPVGASMEQETAPTDVKVPWHGVLAPEGIRSGDGRKFKDGSLSHRDLPLPLTWQKISDDGHKGNVTVATIEQVEMVDGLMRASGHFLDIPEANEVIGLIAEFGKFGVSVDADDATFEVDEEAEEVVFTSARVCSACIVSIPAFAEAWVALGDWATGEDEGVSEPPVYDEVDEDELVASVKEFVDVAPGRTEDGPGWLTHPVDTDRLRDYWVRGPGAAKIAWGTPGDFDRCRVNVAEYVKPQHLNGYCANRHYDALGRWPGRNAHAGESLEMTEASEALSLVAAGGHCAPSEWFANPNFDGPTPLTVTDEGRVFGHIATWGTCHIGFSGTCVTPPHSITDYAYFLTGEVALDDGTRTRCGNITIGGGHAAPRLGMKPALEHYDATSAVVADVTVGDDEHGIWFAGWVRPGTSDEMVTALRASALSGDWRKVGGNLELVAALAVNVPGFGIPRAHVAASSEGQLSLVASGVVAPTKGDQPSKADAEKIADSLAASVAVILEERAERRARMQALAARITKE